VLPANFSTSFHVLSNFPASSKTVLFQVWFGFLLLMSNRDRKGSKPFILWLISGIQRTALLWVITQQVVVISYRLFGATYRSHLQGMTHENRIDRLPLKSVKSASTRCIIAQKSPVPIHFIILYSCPGTLLIPIHCLFFNGFIPRPQSMTDLSQFNSNLDLVRSVQIVISPWRITYISLFPVTSKRLHKWQVPNTLCR